MLKLKNNNVWFELPIFQGTITEIEIIDGDNILTNEIITKLKEYLKNETIVYFNDLSCKHWIFDFKIDNVWFTSKSINNELTKFTLESFR